MHFPVGSPAESPPTQPFAILEQEGSYNIGDETGSVQDDAVSSLKFADGYQVTFYADRDRQGASGTSTTDTVSRPVQRHRFIGARDGSGRARSPSRGVPQPAPTPSYSSSPIRSV